MKMNMKYLRKLDDFVAVDEALPKKFPVDVLDIIVSYNRPPIESVFEDIKHTSFMGNISISQIDESIQVNIRCLLDMVSTQGVYSNYVKQKAVKKIFDLLTEFHYCIKVPNFLHCIRLKLIEMSQHHVNATLYHKAIFGSFIPEDKLREKEEDNIYTQRSSNLKDNHICMLANIKRNVVNIDANYSEYLQEYRDSTERKCSVCREFGHDKRSCLILHT